MFSIASENNFLAVLFSLNVSAIPILYSITIFLFSKKAKTEEIKSIFKECKKVKIVGTYTHFSKAIDEKWTRIQFKRFEKCIELIKNSVSIYIA